MGNIWDFVLFNQPEPGEEDEFYIHPLFVAAGVTEDDFPAYGKTAISMRARVEDFDLPNCSRNAERKANWPADGPYFVDRLEEGQATREEYGYSYVLIGEHEGDPLYAIYSDDGTYHG